MTTTLYGYLETPYLMGPYLGGYVAEGMGSQIDMILLGHRYLRSQTDLKIYDLREAGSQTLGKIYAVEKLGSQVDIFLTSDADDEYLGSQAELVIYDVETIGSQSAQKLYKARLLGSQSLLKIEDSRAEIGSQTEMRIDEILADGGEAKLGKLLHTVWERWLTGPYLMETYLAPGFHAWQGSQISQKLYHPRLLGSEVFKNVYTMEPIGSQSLLKIYGDMANGSQANQKIYSFSEMGSQIEQKIYSVLSLPSQIEMKIYDDRSIGSQVVKIKIVKSGNQVTAVIYNITQLRILQNFASRGTPALGGNNWTSNVPLRAGDFGTKNLNTDVTEERCETAALPATWILTCDTGLPQGAFIDTLAILEHNFTKSAQIVLQGSTVSDFSTIGIQIALNSELINTYYIAPELPTAGYRYWRLVISDLTNPASSLYAGSIVFGSSQIMSVAENFDNPVTFGYRHYKDSIETEGFTSVSNDRAMRKHLALTFNDIRYDAGNFRMLKDYFLANKTDLKCLIIPRPTKPSAFAVFSKLSTLPDETHNAISDEDHYVSFTLDWDESL